MSQIERAKQFLYSSNFSSFKSVNLARYNLNHLNTKNGKNISNTIFLKDLNWKSAKYTHYNNCFITQIPLKSKDLFNRAEISNDSNKQPLKGETIRLNEVNHYLIIREDLQNKCNQIFIIALIWFTPHNKSSEQNIDFLNIKKFNGLMLYSDIEGNVLNLCLFKDGRYQKIDLIENPTHTKGNRTYVKLYAPQVVKSLDCN